jgi:hypothetical protein
MSNINAVRDKLNNDARNAFTASDVAREKFLASLNARESRAFHAYEASELALRVTLRETRYRLFTEYEHVTMHARQLNVAVQNTYL